MERFLGVARMRLAVLHVEPFKRAVHVFPRECAHCGEIHFILRKRVFSADEVVVKIPVKPNQMPSILRVETDWHHLRINAHAVNLTRESKLRVSRLSPLRAIANDS